MQGQSGRPGSPWRQRQARDEQDEQVPGGQGAKRGDRGQGLQPCWRGLLSSRPLKLHSPWGDVEHGWVEPLASEGRAFSIPPLLQHLMDFLQTENREIKGVTQHAHCRLSPPASLGHTLHPAGPWAACEQGGLGTCQVLCDAVSTAPALTLLLQDVSAARLPSKFHTACLAAATRPQTQNVEELPSSPSPGREPQPA